MKHVMIVIVILLLCSQAYAQPFDGDKLKKYARVFEPDEEILDNPVCSKSTLTVIYCPYGMCVHAMDSLQGNAKNIIPENEIASILWSYMAQKKDKQLSYTETNCFLTRKSGKVAAMLVTWHPRFNKWDCSLVSEYRYYNLKKAKVFYKGI